MFLQEIVEAKELCAAGHRCLHQAFETHDPQQIAEAVAHFAEAISCWPELEEPYLALAFIAKSVDQPEDMRRLLRQVVSLNPTHPQAHRLLESLPDLAEAPAFNAASIHFPSAAAGA